MTVAGRFADAVPKEGFALARGEQDIVLTKRDVDLFQRAKAAIGSGTEILLARAGMGLADVRRVCVGGFFGRFLNIGNASEIGLLPAINPESVELCGCTALAGCEDALLEPGAAELLMSLRDRARLVDMSRCPEFDDIFLKNLYLLPMRGE